MFRCHEIGVNAKTDVDDETAGSLIDQIVMDLFPKAGVHGYLRSGLYSVNVSSTMDSRGKRSEDDLGAVVSHEEKGSKFDLIKLADDIKHNVDLGVTGLSKPVVGLDNPSESGNGLPIKNNSVTPNKTKVNRKKFNQTEFVNALRKLISKPKTMTMTPLPSTKSVAIGDDAIETVQMNSDKSLDSYGYVTAPSMDKSNGADEPFIAFFEEHSTKASMITLPTSKSRTDVMNMIPTIRGFQPPTTDESITSAEPPSESHLKSFEKQSSTTATKAPITSTVKSPPIGQVQTTVRISETVPPTDPTTKGSVILVIPTTKSPLKTTKSPLETTKSPLATTKPPSGTTNSTLAKLKKSKATSATPVYLYLLTLPILLTLF